MLLFNQLKAKTLQSQVMPDINSDQFKLFQQLQFQIQLKQKQYLMLMQQQMLSQVKNQTDSNVIEAFLQNSAVQQLQQQQQLQQMLQNQSKSSDNAASNQMGDV